MNGFQLYKQYMATAEKAPRGSADWAYGQVLISAFYTVGITRLFDMLEQAEEQGCRVGLVYSLQSGSTLPLPCGIELVKAESVNAPFAHQPATPQWTGYQHY